MDGLDKYIDEINDKKEMIARAIAMAVTDGNASSAEKYFGEFYRVLKEECPVFILDSSMYYTEFEKRVRENINKLNEMLGYDIEPYLKGNVKIDETNIHNYLGDDVSSFIGLSKDIFNKCHKFYMRNYKLYVKLGIDLTTIINLYLRGGNDSIDNFNLCIKRVLKDMHMFDFKKNMAIKYELRKMQVASKKFVDFCSKYNIKDMNDLLDFNIELDSFLIDDKDYGEEQRVIVNKNRNNFRKRMGKGSEYYLSENEALALKNRINDIFNYSIYNHVFKNSNFRKFFYKNNIKISKKNLHKCMDIYFNALYSTGVCAKKEFDNKSLYYCLFNSSILNSSSRWQNEVIVHEFIHSLEGPAVSYSKRLSHYTALNEALTEYLTIEALKYLDENILSCSDENEKNRSAYENMLPMVEKIKNSDVWSCFLSAKLMDDAESLEDRIGYANFRDICMYFDIVYQEPFNEYNGATYAKEIELILNKIDLRKR